MLSSAKKAVVRSGSFAGTAISNFLGIWQTFHRISPGIFLGIIPTRSAYLISNVHYEMHKQIIAAAENSEDKRPLRLILSVIEKEEIEGQGFYGPTMVSPQDWKDHNIDQIIVEMPDFTAVVLDKAIKDAIFAIRDVIQNGGSVYIHCKAGRSRSVMLCAIYLSLYGPEPHAPREMSLENAAELIRKVRPHIDFDAPKIAKAKELIPMIKTAMRKRSYLEESLPKDFPHKLFNLIDDYFVPEEKKEAEAKVELGAAGVDTSSSSASMPALASVSANLKLKT